MKAVSKYHPLSHYVWCNGCDGWNLLANEHLVIKLEHMPPGTAEAVHYHQQAQQFFFILSGAATFEMAGQLTELKSGEGLAVPAGARHRILNNTDEGLEFLVCSQPSTANDRINDNG